MFWPAYGIQGRVLDSAFGLLALSFLLGFDFGPDAEEAFVRCGFAEFEGWVLQERHCLASAARRAAKRRAERRGGQARALRSSCGLSPVNRRGFIRLGRVEEDLRGEKVVTQLAGSAGVIQRVHSHAVTGREVAQRPSGSAYAGRRGTDGGLRWGCDSKAGDNASGGMHVVGGTEGRAYSESWAAVVGHRGGIATRSRGVLTGRAPLVSEACDINKRESRERAVMKSRESGVMSEIRDPYARLKITKNIANKQSYGCSTIKNSGPDRNITRRVHAKPSKVHVNQNFFYS
ncbi:hypothetical protein GGX14DRAFT_635811 [Mycena pura]|uniref:Uncharacterized protein n=1 Tax=Mycena pura TaxID=153505 RepID=A0AAD6VBA3_9AGAR|nr:hypothetical protein GGX14DRAFT_635811 [Mycena pura]